MDTGITLSHPPSNITQLPTMMQMKTTQALSRLLPHNQPGLKELIPPQKPLPTHKGRRRKRRIITLTTIRIPACIQLPNKNKAGCNLKQSLQQIEAGIHTEILPLFIYQPITAQEITCPSVHNEMLQCTINNSFSSEVQFLNPTQLVTQLSANLDNLPNSIVYWENEFI